jgi:uncharacterized membrane-anchored protein
MTLPVRAAWQKVTKVPKITSYFWVIKILTTGMGEAASDYLAHRFNPILAGSIGLIVFGVALLLQFRAITYRPSIYWFAVAMVAVFGTMAADGLHVELGIPYIASTAFYAITLVVVFISWYKVEGTLSIHSIHTRRREMFYWATVLATFAMGTALGDLTAYTAHLGYLISGIVFALVFLIPTLGYWHFRLNSIFAFWLAYIITRPLGASFADWVGVPKDLGGLNLGRGTVRVALSLLIVSLVWFVGLTQADTPARPVS